MRKNDNNENRNNRKSITKVVNVHISGLIGNYEYDVESVTNLLTDLQNNDVFSKLSIPVTMSKKICFNDESAKGVLSVARIKSWNPENETLTLSFPAKHERFADIADDMVIIPRVRTRYNSKEVVAILGFGLYFLTSEEDSSEE